MTTDAGDRRSAVRDHYAEMARDAADGNGTTCCGGDCGALDADAFGSALYAAGERDHLPDAAILASAGCGNPTAVASLEPGQDVLDLGSGGGIDVILSARRVAPGGTAHGVDMTDAMLDLARANAADAGVDNVVFHRGTIESVPLDDQSVDVVISNCVVNLSADKRAVLAEAFRLLRPDGRLAMADVVAEDGLDAEARAERGSWEGCIAGAMSVSEMREGLEAAGFRDVDIELTHPVADAMHSAIVRARRPAPCC